MATVIRWFKAFRDCGKSELNSLKWELSTFSGERAAEWTSGAAFYQETYRVEVCPDTILVDGHTGHRKDFTREPIWVTVNRAPVGSRDPIYPGTEIGSADKLFVADKQLAFRLPVPSDYARYQEGVKYLVEITLNPTRYFNIRSQYGSGIGFLYSEKSVTKKFLSDCWSERNADGSLTDCSFRDPSDASSARHTECFVTGAPIGLVLRISGSYPTLKLARALAAMRKLPIYRPTVCGFGAEGVRRIN